MFSGFRGLGFRGNEKPRVHVPKQGSFKGSIGFRE